MSDQLPSALTVLYFSVLHQFLSVEVSPVKTTTPSINPCVSGKFTWSSVRYNPLDLKTEESSLSTGDIQ